MCVATTASVQEKNELLVQYDGWLNAYDYWYETEAIELFPMGFVTI